MALSNYSTLAVKFTITERVLPLEQSPEPAHKAAAEIAAKLAPLAAFRLGESDDSDREGDALMREIMNDPEYHSLIHDEFEARTTREIDAEICDGSFQSPSTDLRVDIYKNWAYLRSPSMWQAGGSFVEPTIMQLTDGEAKIGGLYVQALRSPQDGIGIVVYADEYGEDESGSYTRYRGMLGLGVSAYEELRAPDANGDEYRLVGVLPETVEWLRTRIGNGFPEFLKVVDLSSSRHFNQGDAFFAGEFGIDTPSSDTGETSEPLLADAIQGLSTRLKAGEID